MFVLTVARMQAGGRNSGFGAALVEPDLFQRATAAYTARCRYQGLAPLDASVLKSAVSERFVDLRTEANLKLGMFFPSADEFLCYGHHPQ